MSRWSKTWSPPRIWGMVFFAALSLATLVVPYAPLGLGLWLGFCCVVFLWPNPLTKLLPEDKGYAFGVKAYGMRRALQLKATVLYRLGAPGECEDQQKLAESRKGPISYAAMGAICAAGIFVGLDWMASAALSNLQLRSFPEYYIDPTNRNFFVALGSAPFGWVMAHAVMMQKRYAAAGDETGTACPAAVLQESIPEFILKLIRGWYPKIVWPLVLLVLAAELVVFRFAAPIVGALGLSVVVVAGALLWIGRRSLMADVIAQREEWEYKRQQVNEWNGRWMSLSGSSDTNIPLYRQEADIPAAPETPTHRRIIFQLKAGRNFTNYVDESSKLAPGLGKSLIVIEPFVVRGEPHWGLFQVTHELTDFPPNPHLIANEYDPATQKFVIKAAMLKTLHALKLGQPVFMDAKLLTTPESKGAIFETLWALPAGMTFENYVVKTPDITEKLMCEWARVYVRPDIEYMSIFFGIKPAKADFATPRRARRRGGENPIKRELQKVDWAYYMRASKMIGSTGQTPVLETVKRNELGLDEMTFLLPPGLEASDVAAAIPYLSALSGLGYIRLEYHKDPSRVILITGDRDPLDKTYLFADYEDTLLHPPIPGEPDIDWYLGVGSDGELLRYEWGGEEPHLLIAGSSGSGKSGVINNMLSQMLHNNDPSDVEFWMMEPKNELQAYQHVKHVKYFIDSNITLETPFTAALAVLKAAVAEMEARYSAFSQHPSFPQKLSEARRVAQLDPENSGYLLLPYIFILIEECSSYLKKPALPEQRKLWLQLVGELEELARKARAAGIAIITATQYPTTDNISSTVKQQSRRIGLKTADNTASRVIIDAAGLEKIKIPGRGLISSTKGFLEYRALWMDKPDDDNPHIRDIRMDIINNLPTSTAWPKLPPGLEPNIVLQSTFTDEGSANSVEDVTEHRYTELPHRDNTSPAISTDDEYVLGDDLGWNIEDDDLDDPPLSGTNQSALTTDEEIDPDILESLLQESIEEDVMGIPDASLLDATAGDSYVGDSVPPHEWPDTPPAPPADTYDYPSGYEQDGHRESPEHPDPYASGYVEDPQGYYYPDQPPYVQDYSSPAHETGYDERYRESDYPPYSHQPQHGTTGEPNPGYDNYQHPASEEDGYHYPNTADRYDDYRDPHPVDYDAGGREPSDAYPYEDEEEPNDPRYPHGPSPYGDGPEREDD